MTELLEIAGRFWRADRGRFAAGIAACAITVLSEYGPLGSGWLVHNGLRVGGVGRARPFIQLFGAECRNPLPRSRTHGEPLCGAPCHARCLAAFPRAPARRSVSRGLSGLNSFAFARWRRAEMLQRVTGDVDALDGLYLRLILPAATVAVLAMVLTPALMSVGWAETLLVAGMLAQWVGNRTRCSRLLDAGYETKSARYRGPAGALRRPRSRPGRLDICRTSHSAATGRHECSAQDS